MRMRRYLPVLLGLSGLSGPAWAQSWTLTDAPLTNWVSVASSADGGRLVAAAHGLNSWSGSLAGPIYISTNACASWQPVLPANPRDWPFPELNWQSVASSADGGRLFSVGIPLGDVLYPCPMGFSMDAGDTWTNSGTFAGLWTSVAVSGDGTGIAVTDYVTQFPGPHISTDSGVTWITAGISNASCCAWSANGTTLLVAGNWSVLAASTNKGLTWTTTRFTNVWWASVAASANGTRLVAAAHSSRDGAGNVVPGFVCTSADAGLTWKTASAPSNYWRSVASSANGYRLVAAASYTNGGSIYTSADAGATWTSNDVPHTFWTAVASSADGGRLVAADRSGGIYTYQTTLPPVLHLTPSGGDAELSWVTPSTRFVLQQSSESSGTNRSEVTVEPALNLKTLRHQVILPQPAGNRFFRLTSL